MEVGVSEDLSVFENAASAGCVSGCVSDLTGSGVCGLIGGVSGLTGGSESGLSGGGVPGLTGRGVSGQAGEGISGQAVKGVASGEEKAEIENESFSVWRRRLGNPKTESEEENSTRSGFNAGSKEWETGGDGEGLEE